MKRDELLNRISNKLGKFETFEHRTIFNNFKRKTNDRFKGIIVKDLPIDGLRRLNKELDNSMRLFVDHQRL